MWAAALSPQIRLEDYLPLETCDEVWDSVYKEALEVLNLKETKKYQRSEEFLESEESSFESGELPKENEEIRENSLQYQSTSK